MINVRNIVVCAIKSRKIVEATSIAAILYPLATYYIVSTIPKYGARTMYTKMHHEVLYSIAMDSIDLVEKTLIEKGVKNIEKKIIQSRKPGRDFIKFIKSIKADLIVATTPDIMGKIGSKLFVEAHRSHRLVLVSTARSRWVQDIKKLMLLVSKPSISNQALYFSFKLAERLGAEVSLITMEKPGSIDVHTVKMYSSSRKVKVHVEPITRYKKNYIDEILDTAENNDLFIVDRTVFIKHKILHPILWFYKLSKDEELLLKKSPIPILYM
ncbi:hypothetical protein J4526_00775 [Desulfurococcaceae archaeon MEX13E-LK6-19]|nr:hypothetical protein J4526_00775 [Desulfurococcaceae archaeon MEX13E-LK6-19]